MEELYKISDYQIRESKTGKKIPVINGIQLHSIYNPEKEADELIDKHQDLVKNNKSILCLGLGFGYHIAKLLDSLENTHKSGFSVVVIEPLSETYQQCKSNNLLPTDRLTIYHGQKISELYRNVELVDFLLKKPGVISHAPSFNLHKQYFTDFLTYRSPENIGEIKQHITNKSLKEYLSRFAADTIFSELLTTGLSSKNSIMVENDHLLMAFKHMAARKREN